MKKRFALFLFLFVLFGILPLPKSTMVYANSHTTNNTRCNEQKNEKLLIDFTKNWDDEENEAAKRPDYVTVKLYKFIDTFDSDAILIETVNVTAQDEWKHSFDISDQSLKDKNDKEYKFTVVEEEVSNYEVSSSTDPVVTVNPMSFSSWDKIAPCNSLDIPFQSNEKTIVLSKLTKNAGIVVWTMDELNSEEKQLAYTSSKNAQGIGNPKFNEFIFIYGPNASYKGLSVINNKIIYEKTSNWSLIWVGKYTESSVSVSNSQITNKYIAPVYVPKAAQVTLCATKKLDNFAPKENNFTFYLKDNNGNILQAKNNNGLNIAFDALSFSSEGRYIYTIEEAKGDNSDVEYDTSVYTVQIDISKDTDYKADISYFLNDSEFSGTIIFNNTTNSLPDDKDDEDEDKDDEDKDDEDKDDEDEDKDDEDKDDEDEDKDDEDKDDEDKDDDNNLDPSDDTEPIDPPSTSASSSIGYLTFIVSLASVISIIFFKKRIY